MRVRWLFYFEYEDLKFEKVHTYGVQISAKDAAAFGLPAEEVEAKVTIGPDEKRSSDVRQLGQMNIFLPGNSKETEDLAYSLAINLAERISFSQASIKLDGSFISNELLPETAEEEALVGENRFSWTVQVREVPQQIPFEPSAIRTVNNDPLIRQFNEARNAKSPIDRFLGLFKILEDLYGGRPVKKSFKESPELWEIAFQHLKLEDRGTEREISQTELETLIDDLVNTRNNCAHLLRPQGLGITYGDARVQSEVTPLLGPLETLAYEAIQRRL